MKATHIISALGAAAATACAAPANGDALALCRDPYYQDLCGLDVSRAQADAAAALRAGDTRLIGIRGYAITIPGVQLDRDDVETRFGLKAINESGDVVAGEPHTFLIEQATRYAEIYNTAKVADLTARTPS